MKFDLGKQFVSGEFKIIHKDKEGNIKQELNWQPNMFLENGLKVLFNSPSNLPYVSDGVVSTENSKGTYVPQYLIIGTGNSIPAYNQIALDNAVFFKAFESSEPTEVETPDNTNHQGYLKVSNTMKYTFSNFTENLNITEIGCASWATAISNTNPAVDRYTLCTRALIKDNTGTAIPITVLKGEVLVVYYKINSYIDTRRKTGSFTLTDIDSAGIQTTHTFDYFIQPINLLKKAVYGSYRRIPASYTYTIRTRGVLEADSELNSSYNLNDEIYNKINYDNFSPLDQKVTSSSKASNFKASPTNIAGGDHARYDSWTYDWNTKTISLRVINGINTHNWDNGIRAFILPVLFNDPNNNNTGILYNQLVVVKNRANGQGIKKIDTKEWTVEWSYSVDKWD